MNGLNKKDSEMAEMHTHRSDGEVFLVKPHYRSASFFRVKIFSGLYNFPDAQAKLTATFPTYMLYVDIPPF